MKDTHIRRQNILDHLSKNNGEICSRDYIKLGLPYPQTIRNVLYSLLTQGYISKEGKNRYRVINAMYGDKEHMKALQDELERLREIEKKYNAIKVILQ